MTENQLPAVLLPFAIPSYFNLCFAAKSRHTILIRAKCSLRLSYCLQNRQCFCGSCTNSKEAGAVCPKTTPLLDFVLAAVLLKFLFPFAK